MVAPYSGQLPFTVWQRSRDGPWHACGWSVCTAGAQTEVRVVRIGLAAPIGARTIVATCKEKRRRSGPDMELAPPGEREARSVLNPAPSL